MATIEARAKSFGTRQVNAGKSGLALVLECMEHMFKTNDGTATAWLISGLEGNDRTLMKKIIMSTTGGIKVQVNKNQPSGLYISGLKKGENGAPTEDMEVLRILVKNGVSFRSKDVKDALFETVKPKFDVNKYAKTVFNKIDKEGVSINDLMTAISELPIKV